MGHKMRILCAVLAAVMLLGSLAGCSAPRLTIGGVSGKAADIGDTELSAGEYLAYLYNAYYNIYYSQGLYMYAGYYDVWDQTYTYGEGDNAEKLKLAEYIKRTAQDSAVRQYALEGLMKKYSVSWDADEEKKINENLKDTKEDAYLSLGISNDHFISVYKKLNLNESSLFYTLYGEGGQREVPEADRKAYFEKNYLSYKIISIPLTGSDSKELDDAGKKEITDRLGGYLAKYEETKNFEAVVDQYNADEKKDDEKKDDTSSTTSSGDEKKGSTDKDNRKNADANSISDTQLVEAIRSVDVGKAKVVTYKANGSTATAALILRLDINEPASLFTDETKSILYSLKYEEFDKEVDEAVAKITYKFRSSVVRKCDPKDFVQQK